VTKWFTDVERFRNVIGGREELESFIKKLSSEGGTGEIYNLENKKRNQRAKKVDDHMPRKSVKEMTAYETATAKYETYLSTIYFLLDLYEKKKKGFSRFLTSIEKQQKLKQEEDDVMSRQTGRSPMANQGSPAYERSSSNSEDLEEEKDLFANLTSSPNKKNAEDKYRIDSNVSELALSIINQRGGRSTSYSHLGGDATPTMGTIEQDHST